MALKGKGKRLLQAAVDGFTPFKNGNMHAEWLNDHPHGQYGRLPNYWAGELADDIKKYGRVFVIYSYNTPIAWRGGLAQESWTQPEVHYSATTTNHQNVVTTAILNPGFYTNSRW